MTAYVEQLCRSEKRVNLIEGSLQIPRLLLSNDQAHRRGLASFLDLASGVMLLGILHVFSNDISFQFSYVISSLKNTAARASLQGRASKGIERSPEGPAATQMRKT